MNDTTDSNINLENLETDLNELVENTESSTITEVPSEVSNTQIFLVLPSQNTMDITEDDKIDKEILDNSIDSIELKSVNVSNETITASDTNGLKSALLNVIGDYTTIVTDYTYSNGSYTSHAVETQPDYIWIGTFLFFTLVICSLIKFISICSRGYRRHR